MPTPESVTATMVLDVFLLLLIGVGPKIALVSNIILMIAVLLWRPAGLFSANRR